MRALLEDYVMKGKNKTGRHCKHYMDKLIKKWVFFFSILDLPQCSGRIALITGGTRGIGLEVIKMLLQCDIHVIIGTVNSSCYC